MERFWSKYFGLSAIARSICERFVGPLGRTGTGVTDVLPLVGLYALFVALLLDAWLVLGFPGVIILDFVILVPASGTLAIVLLINLAYATWDNLREGHGSPQLQTGPEPAYRNYFFGNASQDVRLILLDAYATNFVLLAEIWSATMLLIGNPVFPLLYPIGFLIAIGIMVATALAVAVAGVLAAVQLLLVFLTCAAILSAAYVLRGVELTVVHVRRWFAICPNSGCYKSVGLPVYRCPSCDAAHKQLIPGEYGILRRRCECGEVKLGTLRITGRARLPSFCPHAGCGKPLPTGIEKLRSIHILLVGGPNAGKTTLLAATVYALARLARTGTIALQIPQRSQQEALGMFTQMIESHRFPDKTGEKPPDAFVAFLQDRLRRRAALYMYDPSGEAYRQRRTLLTQNYQKIVSGLMFLIDPFSVRSFVLDFPERTTAANVKPEDPEAVYAREIATLRQTRGVRQSFQDVAIAMVITKADELALPSQADPREWLDRYGLGNLLRTVANDFSKVRYFFTSVNPSEAVNGSFAAPADWLLSLSELDLQSGAGQAGKTSDAAEGPLLGAHGSA